MKKTLLITVIGILMMVSGVIIINTTSINSEDIDAVILKMKLGPKLYEHVSNLTEIGIVMLGAVTSLTGLLIMTYSMVKPLVERISK